MQKIAVLLTCFNRKEKTLSALNNLYKAYENSAKQWKMTIYLTDDGSTDGTAEAVLESYPKTVLLNGNGFLYWAGGMRNSWSKALEENYDAYLLLNDDTNVSSSLFKGVFKTDYYSKDKYGMGGVYIGTTIDNVTKKITYGGSVFENKFLGKLKKLTPDAIEPTACDTGNANIMWVSKNVVDKVGILSEGYVHGMADYDYTMKAAKKDLPVLIMPGIMGECINDHKNPYEKFSKLPFIERLKMLYHPTGLDFKSQLYHMRRHFPLRFPLFLLMAYFKVVFPQYYYNKFYKNRTNRS